MNDFKPNSNKSKELAKKVLKGTIKRKGEISKIADIFITKDIDSVKDYVVHDILIPEIKKIIEDIVVNSVGMILHGSETVQTRKSSNNNSYRNYYDKKDRPVQKNRSRSYEEATFNTRTEANEIIDQMDEIIDKFGFVRVSDFNELAGITGSYTDTKYGWTDIRNANVVRTREGYYIIKLPRALPVS